MQKKLISVLLALFLCLMMTAQADETLPTDNPLDMTGYWLDSWSGRAHITITFDGENHNALIHWANSAFDSVEWTLKGRFENGVLTDSSSVKRYVAYSESGVREETVIYADRPASLTLSEGALLWTDSEGMGADCRFTRYEEIDLGDVFNPEYYAHLYVTDVLSVGGRPCVKGALGTIHENRSLSGFDLRDSLVLPLAADCAIRLKDGSNELQQGGFYAVVRLNEAGEIAKLHYNEEQPDAPTLLKEEIPVVQSMVVPAPPTRK